MEKKRLEIEGKKEREREERGEEMKGMERK